MSSSSDTGEWGSNRSILPADKPDDTKRSDEGGGSSRIRAASAEDDQEEVDFVPMEPGPLPDVDPVEFHPGAFVEQFIYQVLFPVSDDARLADGEGIAGDDLPAYLLTYLHSTH